MKIIQRVFGSIFFLLSFYYLVILIQDSRNSSLNWIEIGFAGLLFIVAVLFLRASRKKSQEIRSTRLASLISGITLVLLSIFFVLFNVFLWDPTAINLSIFLFIVLFVLLFFVSGCLLIRNGLEK